MSLYKNIIFDIGGVVINYQPRQFLLDRFCNENMENKVYDITFGSEEWQLMDKGVMERGVANRIMLEKAEALGCAFEVRSVIEDWHSILTTRRSTVSLLRRLQKMGYHLYFLSNMPSDTVRYLSDRSFWHYFEGGLFSCQINVNKPDPAIYHALMQQYHLVYSETIYVDDNRANAQAAYDLGIVGIFYKGSKYFPASLQSCGIPLNVKKHRKPKSADAAKKEKDSKKQPRDAKK